MDGFSWGWFSWNAITVEYVLAATSVVAIVCLIPLSTHSFIRHRLPKKQEQYTRMLQHLGYTGGHEPAYLPRLYEEFRPRDYFAPVVFASVITLLGAIVLIFGGEILHQDGRLYAPLQTQPVTDCEQPQAQQGGNNDASGTVQAGPGSNNPRSPDNSPPPEHFVSLLLEGPGLIGEKKGSSVALGMFMLGLAFAGAYTWSVNNLFRRLSTLDLSPGVYYTVGQRIIFSMFVVLLLYYLVVPSQDGPSLSTFQFSLIATVSFLVGISPQRVLDRLKNKAEGYMSPAQNKADQLPLDMIEGIHAFEKLRLGEVGIDNAQNLGKAHFLELVIRTPFNPREVIDWIGQARLYLFFKDDIEKLRGAGVRTIFDFRTITRADYGSHSLSQQTGIPEDRLQLVANVVKDDRDIVHLEEAIGKLVGFQQRRT
jgi:hypothetical protein